MASMMRFKRKGTTIRISKGKANRLVLRRKGQPKFRKAGRNRR